MSLIGYSKSVQNPGFDVDLALTLLPAQGEHIVIPAHGAVATVNTISSGRGYSLGPVGTPKEGILCTATGGTGTGAKFLIESEPNAGSLKPNSVIELTAGFSNFQSTLLKNYDVASSNYTYVRDTATGTNIVSGTTTTGGIAATFLVTVTSGTITNVQFSSGGTGYKVGDVVTISIATLQAPMNVINGGGTVILSDLTLLLTEDNVMGGLSSSISIVAGGNGYTVADVLILQEEGSSVQQTGTVTVATLGSSDTVGEFIPRYPQGVMFTEAGISGTTPGTVELKQMDDTQVLIGGMITGEILPMQFKEITAAGTTSEAGITIFYSGS